MEENLKRRPNLNAWVFIVEMDSPIGLMRLFFTEVGLASLVFADKAVKRHCEKIPGCSINQKPNHPADLLRELTCREISRYFNSDPAYFQNVPVDLKGTPFQIRVWQELQKIPPGQTISYRELAARIGNPKASRAVGQAVGANPIPIIIPCHRVIASNGSLGGYSSGLDRKRWLLKHEQTAG
ncbi:MAG: methylated-DNA--[protein]-cysteine S-methyltransferase [Deltaproteobacteria bacterium]|nr:methylated-DNA--[protein]-cysteine S-methyltransferase [Deltaproteobacteria bacterium]